MVEASPSTLIPLSGYAKVLTLTFQNLNSVDLAPLQFEKINLSGRAEDAIISRILAHIEKDLELEVSEPFKSGILYRWVGNGTLIELTDIELDSERPG